MTAVTHQYDAVFVGGGPRAVATIIRLAARQETADEGARTRPLRLVIVDALEVGSGATWLTTQPAAYLNNTTASATTLHPDESTPMSGPAAPGPDLVDWMQQVADAGTHPAGDWVVEEARALRAQDFTSRRLQGVYYRDQLAAAIAAGGFEVDERVATVVGLESVEVEPFSGD